MNATNPPTRSLLLAHRAPLAWDALRDFLVSRGAAGVECAEGARYLRTVQIGSHRGWITVEPASPDALRVTLAPELAPVEGPLVARLRRLFDLDADPVAIDRHLGTDPLLAGSVAACPGLRVPGAFDGFELALRAVLGQQVTVKAATTLFGRFARTFGEPARTPYAGLLHFAPRAQRVALAPIRQLIDLGLTGRRAQTLSDLSGAIAGGALSLDGDQPRNEALGRLGTIAGIGPWTAQYVAMRALRDPDAFPHTDLGLMKALTLTRPREVLARVERWRPYRAYAALRCWKQLAAGG